MSTAYREATECKRTCSCECHDKIGHRIARRLQRRPWKRILLIVGLVVVGVGLIVWAVRAAEASNERERVDALHRTKSWIEDHEPCRETSEMVGPHFGQGNAVSCRKDQHIETHDVADGTLITCLCPEAAR